ncbi:NAD-dependent malic enzyme [Rhizobium leguminosarum]|uniref:NAD-dependent malic enzyme n=1 Tax=Rhizobium leguminosarum TaxID=384 RepID=UPI0021BBE651|nr:NAD-dependent malic enzyme [Rhizobium leguminosarum]MBY5720663.1 NAD-dependent malic enzyme [Rhizobium leguminosarum]
MAPSDCAAIGHQSDCNNNRKESHMSTNIPTGHALLHDSRLNKGTAFTVSERREFGLEGLLPPVPLSLELQVSRLNNELAELDNDLQRYLLLLDLQVRNETLFYALLMSDPARFMPIVYTPTVGEGCQKFDHIYRNPRGMYLPISARGRLRELLANWPETDVRFIVVTDGERILGLGDLGVGGMGIPIGKLALYTTCAGVPPQYCLPVTLDVGTNNPDLLEDPLYLGLRQERVRGEAYTAFINEFVDAVQALYPKCSIQWEDFANFNAVPILADYRDKVCTFNDDIQGTAAVALAGIYGALRISGQRLADQRFLFLGGGSAATGIAGLISRAMTLDGMSAAEAGACTALFDVNGLLVASRTDLAEFQKPFALKHEPVTSFVEAVKALRPTAIIGVSTMPKLFNQQVIEAMSEINERPVIFPYSNPTSRSECTAAEAYRWSAGRAIFASGSPFAPVEVNGRTFVPGQGNNVYIFPPMGMAVFATEAERITDDMFIVAAKAVAERVTEEDLATGLIYPPQSKIFATSLHVATRIAECIFDKNLARVERPKDIAALIQARLYTPSYSV